MKRKISLRLSLFFVLLSTAISCLLTSMILVVYFNKKVSLITALTDKYTRLEALDAEIRENFYTTDIDEEALMDEMLKGYVNGLGDPYSTYLTDDELAEVRSDNTGQFVGIGVSVILSNEENVVTVKEVFPDSPASQAGISAGDLILQVNDLLVADDATVATDAIKGVVGSEVTVMLQRIDGSEYTVTMKRATVEEITIYHEMLEGNVGYIRITKFRTITAEQFQDAFDALCEQGAKGIIFDVRNNGGGLLSALETITDPLLPEGDLAFAYDQDGNATPIITSDADCVDMPFVILTNGSTASAAELFACLLRDYADAVLVGEKTFGKGIMQTTYSLPDDGGLTLTTATYSTGETECYHGIGITPSVISEYDASAENDTQLADALEVLKDLLHS